MKRGAEVIPTVSTVIPSPFTRLLWDVDRWLRNHELPDGMTMEDMVRRAEGAIADSPYLRGEC